MGHVAEEIRICLISLYGGMLIGLIYDVSAFIRLPFGEGRLISAVFDALFYVAAGCMAAYACIPLYAFFSACFCIAASPCG